VQSTPARPAHLQEENQTNLHNSTEKKNCWFSLFEVVITRRFQGRLVILIGTIVEAAGISD